MNHTSTKTRSLLRVATAGSVDDGKSTLIGRLLYESKSLMVDQLAAVERATTQRGFAGQAAGTLDLSLLTDGLLAEREQGITIDVAYRYFATPVRQFILADSPGHEQYTRNMVTAASTADVAIVLIDATKGVLTQTRRHALLSALLHVPRMIVAVNKMDLVQYDQAVFARIVDELTPFLATYPQVQAQFIPVSALVGDNIVAASANMPWYQGAPLLPLLEGMDAAPQESSAFRFAVQRIARPTASNPRRGYQGTVNGGTIALGDTITVHPAGRSAKVARIVTWDAINVTEQEHASAERGAAISLELDTQIDVSRGDVLVHTSSPATVATTFSANLCWMDDAPANLDHGYTLKLGTHVAPVELGDIDGIFDLSAGGLTQQAGALTLNTLARVRLKARRPLALDAYAANRHTGSFVLIDEVSNRTVAAGMVVA